MKKFPLLLAVVLMAAPTLSHAAMAGANTVNSAAIVDGSVATADLANKAVTGAKIADATVTATQLAAGAVTDAKISGTISASKIQSGVFQQKFANTVVVAKSGGDFTSPVQALASITTASAANPFLVKVMPGVYNLGGVSLQMKPYVYLEGSGDSSVIASTVANTDGQCFVGTINMANNSAVRNIRITNVGTAGGQRLFAGVAFNNVVATLEGSNVIAGLDSVYYDEVAAVCTQGAAAVATVNNCNLEAHSSAGNSDTISVTNNSSLQLSNSRVLAVSGESTHLVDCHNFYGIPTDDSLSMANITITNSYLEGSAPNNNEIFWGNGCKTATIADSVIVVKDSSWGRGITTTRDTTVINTRIYASSTTPGNDMAAVDFDASSGYGMKVMNSFIQGSIPNLANVKLFNNCDGDLNPILNQ